MRGFQTQVTRWLTGRLQRRTPGGMWRYTLAAAAREEAEFLTMEEYIRRRQNTFTKYTATQSLIYLCEVLERDPGSRLGMWWWEQVEIDLPGAQEAEAVTAEGDGGEE